MIALPFILNCLINFAVGILVAKLLGPTEFGRFALVMSIALVLQTLGFDWLRLSATRFYSEQDRVDRPEIRSTLDATFLVIAGLGLFVTIIVALCGNAFPISPALVALSIATAFAVALFEFSAALLRARLEHRRYGIFVIVKNVLSLSFTAGAAWYFKSATFALAGLIVSVVGCFVACYPMLRDKRTDRRLFDPALASSFARYAFPIVIGNVFYLAIPMVDRALVSHVHDFASAGQLALAYDLGNRIIGSLGAAMDVLLFQIAVSAERTIGPEAARRQLSRNMGLFCAAIPSVALGTWIVLPSFQAVFIPQAFHGSFARCFAIMLPGIMCGTLANCCIAPVFQIAHRTAPLIWGGIAAFLANGLTILVLPASADATTYALAQSISSAVGAITIVAYMCRSAPIWPSRRDVSGVAASLLALFAVGFFLRTMAPGAIALAVQTSAGAVIYITGILAFNVGELRSVLVRFLHAGRRWHVIA